jgi:hypothetical protein
MRALLAGLFAFVMLLVAVAVVSFGSKNGEMAWWGFPVVLVTLGLSIIAALSLFNKRDRSPYQTDEQVIAELRAQGLLFSEKFEARRAFEVAESEDEGSHFFIELADGGVLFLTGQYLYDYRGPRKERELSFPCGEFTILRHKTERHVVNIVCEGRALPIECTTPHFSDMDFELDAVPEDGQVMRDRSYDEIKKERLNRG